MHISLRLSSSQKGGRGERRKAEADQSRGGASKRSKDSIQVGGPSVFDNPMLGIKAIPLNRAIARAALHMDRVMKNYKAAKKDPFKKKSCLLS